MGGSNPLTEQNQNSEKMKTLTAIILFTFTTNSGEVIRITADHAVISIQHPRPCTDFSAAIWHAFMLTDDDFTIHYMGKEIGKVVISSVDVYEITVQGYPEIGVKSPAAAGRCLANMLVKKYSLE